MLIIIHYQKIQYSQVLYRWKHTGTVSRCVKTSHNQPLPHIVWMCRCLRLALYRLLRSRCSAYRKNTSVLIWVLCINLATFDRQLVCCFKDICNFINMNIKTLWTCISFDSKSDQIILNSWDFHCISGSGKRSRGTRVVQYTLRFMYGPDSVL